MKYKVLWIDDDCNTTGKDFIGQAEQDDVDIIAFESHEEGIAFLENNLSQIHAVILDAKVKNRKDDTVIGIKGLKASRDRLIEINSKLDLPYFIFTGQPDYQTDEIFKESYGDFYVKGVDNERIIIDLIDRIENREDYILQKEYRQVFEVCSEKYIGVDSQKYLLQILSSIKKPNFNFDDELYFTQLRIILELMFRASNKYGLLHDVCISNGKVNLSESSLFLSGAETKHLNVFSSVSHFPKLISDAVKTIIFITGAASHTSDGNPQKNINLEDYRKTVKTPYLLYSLTFQLLDILIWFKEYIDKNNDVILNKSYWQTTLLESINSSEGWIEGKVSRIADNGYGTFLSNFGGEKLSIVPNLVTELNLNVNDIIRVTTKHDKSGTKVFIDLIEKI